MKRGVQKWISANHFNQLNLRFILFYSDIPPILFYQINRL